MDYISKTITSIESTIIFRQLNIIFGSKYGLIHVYPLSSALFPRKSKGGANNATMLVICGAPWVIIKTMIWAIKVIGRGGS